MEFKQRLVIVGEPELSYLLAHQNDMGVPYLYKTVDGKYYVADPDDMRAWRASQHTSTGDGNG